MPSKTAQLDPNADALASIIYLTIILMIGLNLNF